MGLPVNIEVNRDGVGAYVIEAQEAGVNSKLVVTRLSDDRKEQLIMKDTWWFFLDGLCAATRTRRSS